MVSVIITVKGRQDHLTNTLLSLNKDSEFIGEVILVHMNQDPKPSLKFLAYNYNLKQYSIFTNEADLVIAKARNFGALLSSSDKLLFLDVDCLIQEKCVENYLNHLTSTNILMGKCLYLPEKEEHPYRTVDKKPGWELFWSLSFMTSKPLFDYLNGFDEQFTGYGFEDNDFAYRAHKSGIEFKWVPDAVVVHQHHPPSKKVHSKTLELNKNKFHKKHGFVL